MARTAVARRRQNRRERAVFIQAVQKRNDDGKRATAQNVRTENPVFRAEYKQSDKDPKGYVTLGATIHKKPPVFRRRYM